MIEVKLSLILILDGYIININMKVFIFVCNKQYGGGMAVVAAYDAQDAFQLLREEYGGDDFVYEYTDLMHCHMSKDLIANVTKPQVLESDFHVE